MRIGLKLSEMNSSEMNVAVLIWLGKYELHVRTKLLQQYKT